MHKMPKKPLLLCSCRKDSLDAAWRQTCRRGRIPGEFHENDTVEHIRKDSRSRYHIGLTLFVSACWARIYNAGAQVGRQNVIFPVR